jgi:hypothetical protein
LSSSGAAPAKFKNRIDSWLKDAEEDASKAEKYLDKKKEKKTSTDEMVDKTDVIKTMEAIEKVSSSKPRKKTPPASETERKKQLIRSDLNPDLNVNSFI